MSEIHDGILFDFNMGGGGGRLSHFPCETTIVICRREVSII